MTITSRSKEPNPQSFTRGFLVTYDLKQHEKEEVAIYRKRRDNLANQLESKSYLKLGSTTYFFEFRNDQEIDQITKLVTDAIVSNGSYSMAMVDFGYKLKL